MLILILTRYAACQLRYPRLTVRPKLFDVRFPEILRRPIRLNSYIAGEKSIIVAFGKRLVAERRQRMFGRSPFPVAPDPR